MLLNLSNHPSDFWSDKQFESAFKMFSDSVRDIPFPAIDPQASEEDITKLAEEYADKCQSELAIHKEENNAVHAMGEFNFVFAVVSLLLKKGIKCVASTSGRESEETESGEKLSKFNFIKFREYKLL